LDKQLAIIAFSVLLLVPMGLTPAFAQVSDFFWSEDDGTGEIFTADSAGQNVGQVTSGGFARIDDVEIDPLANKLWWNNWVPGGGAGEDIYNSDLNGANQASLGLVSSCGPSASGLTGIVLDPANLRLFYTRGVSYNNCPNGEVSRVNMDGSGYTMLDSAGGDSWHPDGIELSGGTVFWGNPGIIPSPADGSVNSMDTNGGTLMFNLVPHVDGDGRSLSVDATKALLFYSAHNFNGRSVGGEIFVVDLNNIGAGATNVLSDLQTGIPDIELDTANMRIYWTDYVRGEIRSASYDAVGTLSPHTVEISGLTNPYGLALAFGVERTAVGGELVTLDSTMVLVAGAQYNAAWMIPIIVSAAGIGLLIQSYQTKLKHNSCPNCKLESEDIFDLGEKTVGKCKNSKCRVSLFFVK